MIHLNNIYFGRSAFERRFLQINICIYVAENTKGTSYKSFKGLIHYTRHFCDFISL